MDENQERLVVVLDRDLKARVRDLAWERRMNLSDYVRAVLQGVVRAERKAKKEGD